MDIGPNYQVSQCVIYHWRPFNTFHSVLLVAEIAGARLAQVEGSASLPIKTVSPTIQYTWGRPITTNEKVVPQNVMQSSGVFHDLFESISLSRSVHQEE